MSETTKYNYAKLMEGEKITLAELPEDVRIAIKDIGKAERGIAMAESKGRNVNGAKSKLKALDKWASRDIQDYIDGKKTPTNTAPAPTATEIIEAIEQPKPNEPDTPNASSVPANEPAKEDKPDPKGLAIEAELKAMFDSGKKEFELDSLKSVAPKSYSDIFDDYKEGGENGVATSYYTLKETSPKIFVVSKN